MELDNTGEPVQTRKVRMMQVEPGAFMTLFKKGLRVRASFKIIKGLPEDAKLLGIAYEPTRGGVMLVVESQSYVAIPLTMQPPVQMVKIEINDDHVKKAKAKKKKRA